MSNITKTSARIKQKLSLNDYRKPENKTAPRTAIKPARTHTAHSNKITTTNDDAAPKIKATYYLGAQENSMLMALYIDRLKNCGRADKSAIVCQAIRLLYAKEK